MVPLIALDELPPTINIRGVPRSLEAKDMTGMTCAGSADSRHRTYIVDMPDEPTATRTSPSATVLGLNNSLFATSAYAMRPSTNPNIFPQPPKAYGISEQMPSHIKSPVTGNQVPIMSFTSSPPTRTAPLRVDRNPGPNPLPPWQDATSVPMKGAPGFKEYCSYWLRCGECDFAQQGCLYKHEMPLDRDVLERLGHRDIPKWYREKHGLGSFLAGGNGISGEKNERMERSWRNAREAEDRERDGAGGRSDERVVKKKTTTTTTAKVVDTGMQGRRNMDKKVTLWRDEGEKEGDGCFAPKSSDKVVASPVSSPTPAKISLVKMSPVKMSPVKNRGPASRSASSTIPTTTGGPASRSATSTATTLGHYQPAFAKKTDEACFAALEADMYAKSREREQLKHLKVHEVLQPKRRFLERIVTPETSSSDESVEFEYGGGKEEGEWVEGDAESQAMAISNDWKGGK